MAFMFFQLLRELADVVKGAAVTAAEFHVIIVDIPSNTLTGFAALCSNAYLVAVRDAELFFIIRCDEADTFLGAFHMIVQPITAITIAVKVIFALVGIDPQHIGILLRIGPKTIGMVVPGNHALRVFAAVFSQRAAVGQNTAILFIKAQSVEDFIKLVLKLLRFEVAPVVVPTGKEAFSVRIHIRPKMADTPGLACDLLTLRVAVFLFCPCHGPDL